MYRHVVTKAEEGQRLDRFLVKLMPNAGTSFLYKMLRKKNIVINHKKSDGNQKIAEGDVIEIFFSDETLETFMGKKPQSTETSIDLTEYEEGYRSLSEVTVLYEDEKILIVNKPVGVLSQKSEKKDLSLNEWLVGYLLSNGFPKEQLSTFRPSVCNRLDRNTSGIVLCSKTRTGAEYLSRILKDRSLHKYYLAPVGGIIDSAFDVHGYLMKNEKTNKVSILQRETPQSSPIHTSFEPLFSFRLSDGTPCTMLKILLHTGKSHQIRAHLSSLGHPILGDPKYGDQKLNLFLKKNCQIETQLLHSYQVCFAAGEENFACSGISVSCPPPQIYFDLTGRSTMENT